MKLKNDVVERLEPFIDVRLVPEYVQISCLIALASRALRSAFSSMSIVARR